MKIASTAPIEELPALPGRGDGDGYDWMEEVQERTSWAVIPSWGRDGWDMGSWPYVQMYTCVRVVPEDQRQPKREPLCIHCRERVWQPGTSIPGVLAAWRSSESGIDCRATGDRHRPARRTKVYGVASYCEGDVDVYAFERHEERIDALDALAQFYWRMSSEDHFGRDGMVPIGPLAAKWFGPFSWDRADSEREEPLIVVQERP
jgi:hypothetical protein